VLADGKEVACLELLLRMVFFYQFSKSGTYIVVCLATTYSVLQNLCLIYCNVGLMLLLVTFLLVTSMCMYKELKDYSNE
jgi:hypothetical protein